MTLRPNQKQSSPEGCKANILFDGLSFLWLSWYKEQKTSESYSLHYFETNYKSIKGILIMTGKINRLWLTGILHCHTLLSLIGTPKQQKGTAWTHREKTGDLDHYAKSPKFSKEKEYGVLLKIHATAYSKWCLSNPVNTDKSNLGVKAQGGRNKVEFNLTCNSISSILSKVIWSSEKEKGIICQTLLCKIINYSIFLGESCLTFPLRAQEKGHGLFTV